MIVEYVHHFLLAIETANGRASGPVFLPRFSPFSHRISTNGIRMYRCSSMIISFLPLSAWQVSTVNMRYLDHVPATTRLSYLMSELNAPLLIVMLTITYRKAHTTRTLQQLQEHGIHSGVTLLFPYSRMRYKHQGRTSNADPMLAIP